MKHTSEEIKYRLSDLGEQIGNIAIEYITELEKENEELRNRNQELLESCEGATMMYKDLQKANNQTTKAKELLKEFVFLLHNPRTALDTKTVMNKTEQFLNEVDK